jgi:hypothetical protein
MSWMSHNLKQHLGVQNAQSWVGDGQERIVSLAGWLYSAVWQWYLVVHAEHSTWPDRPWYTTKRTPSFADAPGRLPSRDLVRNSQRSRPRHSLPTNPGHAHRRTGRRGATIAESRKVHTTALLNSYLHYTMTDPQPRLTG